jgi:hypothetical protein
MSILSQFKQSQNTDFPNVRPSLDLRFALAKKLDPRITFTRGSTGTYFGSDGLMRTAGVNEPRFDHDPITGQSLGLLIEESSSNLLLYSQDLGTGWSNTAGTTELVNVTTAPDGTSTADKLVEDTSSGQHYISSNSVSWASSTTYTLSVFAKAETRYFLDLAFGTSSFWVNGHRRAVFNLARGTIHSTAGASLTALITPYPNGWYRCSITATTVSTAVAATTCQLLITSDGTSGGSYPGDGTSGLYIWGAQTEQGAFPTSYIPTVASIVPRSADNAFMTGTNFSSWYNSSEGTVYSNTRMNGVQNRYDRLWAITNSNLHLEGISVYVAGPVSSGGYVSSITITNGATEQINGAIVESATTTPKLRSAFSFKTNDCASAYNGILRFVDKSAILLSNPDRLLIGQPQRFQGTSCMTISRLTYYPIQLTNQQLINLTS